MEIGDDGTEGRSHRRADSFVNCEFGFFGGRTSLKERWPEKDDNQTCARLKLFLVVVR